MLKATYTPVAVPEGGPDQPAVQRATEKANFVSSLQLEPGEVRAALELVDGVHREHLAPLAGFESGKAINLTPPNSEVAALPVEALVAFGKAVVQLRLADEGEQVVHHVAEAGEEPGRRALASYLAQNAVNSFMTSVKISPIGMLHLERIEMAPAGIERGELIGTVALAPRERTNVVQKTWATTGEEFSSIVTDALENYSEKGVTEKSELSDATQNQTKHNTQLSLGSSVSGSYGTVSFSANASLGVTDATESSVTTSRKQAAELTGKASARVRRERKVTIETRSTVSREDSTTRTLVNPSDTDSMRIDYFSMMRKWRVRLLEYGLRMTYDIGVPEPGGTLRQSHADLLELDRQATTPFTFAVKPSDITTDNYAQLASSWGASVPSPPQPILNQRIGGQVQGLGELDEDTSWHFFTLDVTIPDGYVVTGVWLDAMIGNVDNEDVTRNFIIFGYGSPPGLLTKGKAAFVENLTNQLGFLVGRMGTQKIVYFLQNVDAAAVTFSLDYQPTASALEQWRLAVWQALHDTAQSNYYTAVQALTVRRDALRARLGGVDTLTLRQEERVEIMKAALRWLLGPDFDFMPAEVTALFTAGGGVNGTAFTGSGLGVNAAGWSSMFRYQEMVKFLQEAIEWENLLYFLYPYFWDVPAAWDFVRQLEHPDPERQRFLRSGSARIVLTIRPGYEEAFTSFVDQGTFGSLLPPAHPYLTIGRELQAYGQTNFPGVPPANPEADFRPLLTTAQRTTWRDMQAIIQSLEQYRTTHGRYPTTAQGLGALGNAELATKDSWGNSWQYTCPGRFTDYELTSLGADGAPDGEGESADIHSWAPASLVGEWFEYTPSSGIDIQLNTAPSQMA